jgi:hypothetical protein
MVTTKNIVINHLSDFQELSISDIPHHRFTKRKENTNYVPTSQSTDWKSQLLLIVSQLPSGDLPLTATKVKNEQIHTSIPPFLSCGLLAQGLLVPSLLGNKLHPFLTLQHYTL